MFQCSSASRKFLNRKRCCWFRRDQRVSVLFSEPKIPQLLMSTTGCATRRVSVLFSEPKIPQSGCHSASEVLQQVSVLFSEPKIPQLKYRGYFRLNLSSFSALQRAENSSMALPVVLARLADTVSVLFSEPKIPQSR